MKIFLKNANRESGFVFRKQWLQNGVTIDPSLFVRILQVSLHIYAWKAILICQKQISTINLQFTDFQNLKITKNTKIIRITIELTSNPIHERRLRDVTGRRNKSWLPFKRQDVNSHYLFIFLSSALTRFLLL